MAVALEAGEHVVQFYAHDDELVAAAGRHLTEGLVGGEVAIVIATPSHRRAFERAIAAAGVDVDDATRAGRMHVLDAADTLSRITVDGVLDPGAFDEVVGGLVRRAGSEGRVRAYGEMVALLWDAGQVNAAIELESMWNDLAGRVPFSLFCAYPAQSVTGADRREAYHHVCRLHTGVVAGDGRVDVPQDTEEQSFPASLRSPRAARRFVLAVLERWGRTDLADNAAYVVTELASNAVVHARSDFLVAVTRLHDAVRVSVSDRTSAVPARAERSPEEVTGRGLLMVAALARRWGVQAQNDGKSVWAELGSVASP